MLKFLQMVTWLKWISDTKIFKFKHFSIIYFWSVDFIENHSYTCYSKEHSKRKLLIQIAALYSPYGAWPEIVIFQIFVHISAHKSAKETRFAAQNFVNN